jgi:hypothetical protein
LDSFSAWGRILESQLPDFSDAFPGVGGGAGSRGVLDLDAGAAGWDSFSPRASILDSQLSEGGAGAGGSGGSIDVFGRLRIMSPRRSDIQSASSGPGLEAGAAGFDPPDCTGVRRAPQYLHASALAGFGLPHIGQRKSAIMSAPGRTARRTRRATYRS